MKNIIFFLFTIITFISAQEMTNGKMATDIAENKTNFIKEIVKLINKVEKLQETIKIQQKEIEQLQKMMSKPQQNKNLLSFNEEMSFHEEIGHKSNEVGTTSFTYNGEGVLLFVMASGGGLHQDNRLKIYIDGQEWRNYYSNPDNPDKTNKDNLPMLWTWFDDHKDHNCGWVAVMPMLAFRNEITIELYNGSSGHESCFRVNFLSYDNIKGKE